jgi:uncharacterized membrane protein
MFILQTEIERKTKELSYELFYQLQIYSSNDRNGILIVCFENEQRVEVLADSEIAKLENSNYWNGIVQNLLVAMKSDRMIAGICATIEKLTQLQARKYPS